MLGHRLGDVFATTDSCGHESEGVSPIEGGTRAGTASRVECHTP